MKNLQTLFTNIHNKLECSLLAGLSKLVYIGWQDLEPTVELNTLKMPHLGRLQS
jgi:hypothetical protein